LQWELGCHKDGLDGEEGRKELENWGERSALGCRLGVGQRVKRPDQVYRSLEWICSLLKFPRELCHSS
jgi:hypothetical protein